MRLGRIRAQPSCTVLAQLACIARVWPSLAQLSLGQRSAHGAVGVWDTRHGQEAMLGRWHAVPTELLRRASGASWRGRMAATR
jgi:hypothetical protein